VKPTGLFSGLTTVDLVHYVERFPAPDEKIQAHGCWMGAGGPAANAAAAFAALGGKAWLVTAIGGGALGGVAVADLEANGVEVIDCCSGGELAVSGVFVDRDGRRIVASRNAEAIGAHRAPGRLRDLPAADVVALDAHFPRLAALVLERASRSSAPVVLDPGNWKPHLPALMVSCGHIVASCSLDRAASPRDLLARLQRHRPVLAAVTRGAAPIEACFEGVAATIDVPAARAIDTLGAGDVLHAAYAYHLGAGRQPLEALAAAAVVAARSCEHRGPRISVSRGPAESLPAGK